MSGERYVAAAYVVVLVAVLAYVAIIAAKLGRIDRELDELTALARERQAPEREPVRVG
ncbi:MAG: CcmD family protein [Actinobacteria bacterium]|nr:CcmD family protein [Actinomycetota bacterium]